MDYVGQGQGQGDAPRMDRAMFYAAKYNNGSGLCARQLARIIGHKFSR